MSLSHFPKWPKHGNATFGGFTASLGYIMTPGGGWRRPWGNQGSNSHCGQGPAETGGFWASDLQTGLMSWLESGPGVALVWLWGGFGVALGWLCTPESMPSICLVYGLAVALGGLSVQGSGVRGDR